MKAKTQTKPLFHQRLKSLREERGMSVAQVASKIAVPLSTYREWEYGRKIKGEPYLDLARAFEISLTELFTGEDAVIGLREDLDELRKIAARMRLKL